MTARSCFSGAWLFVLFMGCAVAPEQRTRTVVQPTDEPRLILVTVDGLRWQELFTGMDEKLVRVREKSGVRRPEPWIEAFGGANAKERRERIFPFLWGQMFDRGVLLGDRGLNSAVSVSNPHWISYPGYAELLTGRVQPHIESNKAVPIKVPTVLDFLQTNWSLGFTDVALFASWERFQDGASGRPGSFVVNAGYQDLPKEVSLPASQGLIAIQREMLTPWDDVRHDLVTLELALEFIQRYRPRVTYLALGETDDWAHERRYDRVLQASRRFDDAMRRLWTLVMSLPEYRGNTLLVITTDHGRGVTMDDWTSHKSKIPHSNETWAYLYGPKVPNLGVLTETKPAVLAQLTATILRQLGFAPADYAKGLAPAIPEAFISP